jgi:hypothetical protein
MADMNTWITMIMPAYNIDFSIVIHPSGIENRIAALKLMVEKLIGSQITFGLPRSSIFENTDGIN